MADAAAGPAAVGLNMDLSRPVSVAAGGLDWVASPMPGVERRRLERDGAEHGRATSIVRYAAGATFSPHDHPAGEEYLVLAGTFSDEDGDHAAGVYVRNPPGSRHAPFSRDGCTLFVKLCQMTPGEPAVTVDTNRSDWRAGRSPGHAVASLYQGAAERVSLERLAAGAELSRNAGHGGLELLVLDGEVALDGVLHGTLDWVRLPAGTAVTLASPTGATFWVKRGHLGPAPL